MGGEAILGYYIFRAASGRLGSASSAVTANILALLLSTVLMILIVGTSVGLGEALLPHDHTHESVHAGEDHIDDRENNSESHSGEIKDARFLFLTGWTAVIAVILRAYCWITGNRAYRKFLFKGQAGSAEAGGGERREIAHIAAIDHMANNGDSFLNARPITKVSMALLF